MLELLQKYLIELVQKPYYNKPGYANDRLTLVVRAVMNNDYYKCVHIVSDVIRYTESNGMYRNPLLIIINEEFRKLSRLVSNVFTALMDDPCVFKIHEY